uniref:Ribosome assembly factor mrt4 n=1 Tax=Percolomonas cosmopolitus TaxID=63605 RepID=A0A7S1KNR3_9EUKA|eukprot:CAMPEP_0117450228 /NCGR_PEP_ID=MMETSP0759-20121206/8357_1 /TAXON_ID=63605 /ORGANISM="Percolomonas cosmopolitus, Strain WS" /LENGTH=219 /DNA_ID=CAMNT_0005242737 /DNA_START=30 /DNA_END=689 /DNA_ORIENTATION=+
MPKAQTLQQVTQKSFKRITKESKTQHITNLRENIEEYQHIYVFDYSGKCSGPLKNLKHECRDKAVFFMGRNRVAQAALGKNKEDELRKDLSLVSKQLSGQVVLVFSNYDHDEFVQKLKNFTQVNHASPGFQVDEDYILEEGPIDWVDSCIEQLLIPLEVPVLVKEEKLHAYKKYTIAKAGDKLTPKQTKVLRLLGYQLDVFKIRFICHWTNDEFERMLE